MESNRALRWGIAASLAPALVFLVLGFVCALLELKTIGPHTSFYPPTPVTNAALQFLFVTSCLLGFVVSWRIVSILAATGMGAALPIAVAFAVALLDSTVVSIAFAAGAAIGLVTRGIQTNPELANPINIIGGVMIYTLLWGVSWMIPAGYWAAAGAYLGLVAWLIRWLLRGLFRRSANSPS